MWRRFYSPPSNKNRPHSQENGFASNWRKAADFPFLTSAVSPPKIAAVKVAAISPKAVAGAASFEGFVAMNHIKMDVRPDCADRAAQEVQDNLIWWPLDCLRSLGRAASIAAGTTAPDRPLRIAAGGPQKRSP
jgi:hypothetical protein